MTGLEENVSRKGILIFAAAFLAIVVFISPSVRADSLNLKGNGTEESPYLITNLTELNATRKNLTAHYRLESDIDASPTGINGTRWWNEGSGWNPIGDVNGSINVSHAFRGTFDGNERVIKRTSFRGVVEGGVSVGLVAASNGNVNKSYFTSNITGNETCLSLFSE